MRTDSVATPIHAGTCSPGTSWSTINASEALPGVVTPLTWSLFGDNVERAMKGAFVDMGVLAEDEAVVPDSPDERLWDTWYGRAAGNLATFRMLGDRTPGTSGAAVEVLNAPAGTGKSFLVGTLADTWPLTDPAGTAGTPPGGRPPDASGGDGPRVFGVAYGQRQADVLTEEGVTTRNIRRWLDGQDRLAVGRALEAVGDQQRP